MSRILFALLGLMLIPVSLLAQKDSLGTIVDEVIGVAYSRTARRYALEW